MNKYKYLGIITVLYITFQLISDVTAGKLIEIGGFPVSVTVLYFPITYIFSDILTEVYGYAIARRVVWRTVLASCIAGIVYQIVVSIPPAEGFYLNNAYTTVLGSVPRILIGGWIAVLLGEMANNYVLAKMKLSTQGKYLWARTISSTIVGQFVNTFLFYLIGLYGVIPHGMFVFSILSGWIIKVAVEIICTPLTYKIVNYLKSQERIDYYDISTNFNPFVIRK